MISIDEFLAKNSSLVNKRENIFEKYKDEILELREKGATLKLIVMYLTENYQDVKEKYKNEKTAIAFLSKTIRRWTNSSIKKVKSSKKEDKPKPKGGEDDIKNNLNIKGKSVEEMMNSDIDISKYLRRK